MSYTRFYPLFFQSLYQNSLKLPHFYSGLLGDEDNIVVPGSATGRTIEMIRSKNIRLSGASWEAFSPVNRSFTDLPFRTPRLLWNTLTPKGCISLRQAVWMKTVEVRLEYLFKTASSSWAEVPSKSPISFKCRFSLFLWTEILKFLAMMICRRGPLYMLHEMQKSCKIKQLKDCSRFQLVALTIQRVHPESGKNTYLWETKFHFMK